MKSLGTFASTPASRKKLRRSGASLSAPTNTRATTPDLFDEPVIDRGRQRDHSPGSHRSRNSSHHHCTGSSAPASTRPTTPHLTDEPVTDHGCQRGRSFGSQHSVSRTSLSPLYRGNKRAASQSPSLTVPTKRVKDLKVAQWHNGRAPQGRPKARDYEDTVYRAIIQACHDFEARIGALGAWPDVDKQIAWARDAWGIVCKDIGEQYELTDRMLGLVSDPLIYHFEANFFFFHPAADQVSWFSCSR